MTQRGRFFAYLGAVHLLLAGVAVALLMRRPYWLFVVELVFALSLAIGIKLGHGMLRNLGFAAEGLRLIREREFTSAFSKSASQRSTS